MTPELERLQQLRDEIHARASRVGLPARHGGQQPLRRSAALGLRHRPGLSGPVVLDTTDERTLMRRGRTHDAGTHAVSRRQQERRHGRGRIDGAVLLVAHVTTRWEGAGRHFIAITDPGTALDQLRARTKLSATSSVNPADIGGRFSALSLFGLVPAAADRRAARSDPLTAAIGNGGRLPAEQPRERRARARRVHRRGRARRRDKLTVVAGARLALARPVDRAARGREHRQARQGRAAGRGRTAGRPDEYGNDRAFVAVSTRVGARRRRNA